MTFSLTRIHNNEGITGCDEAAFNQNQYGPAETRKKTVEHSSVRMIQHYKTRHFLTASAKYLPPRTKYFFQIVRPRLKFAIEIGTSCNWFDVRFLWRLPVISFFFSKTRFFFCAFFLRHSSVSLSSVYALCDSSSLLVFHRSPVECVYNG